MRSGRAGGGVQQQRSINLSIRLRPPQTPDPAIRLGQGGTVLAGGRDYAFASSVIAGFDQVAAFEALAAPLISALQRGYSCTLLAYGQTGSGKTHTMFGPPGCLTEAALAQAGGRISGELGCVSAYRSGAAAHAWLRRRVPRIRSGGVPGQGVRPSRRTRTTECWE